MKTRKELKVEYKLHKTTKGVYQIRNKINGKIFIGSSIDLNAIWNRNKTQLNFGNHQNTELQKEWKELGEDAFEYEILSTLKEDEEKEIDFKKEVKFLEELYIDELQPFDEKGYNKKSVKSK